MTKKNKDEPLLAHTPHHIHCATFFLLLLMLLVWFLLLLLVINSYPNLLESTVEFH